MQSTKYLIVRSDASVRVVTKRPTRLRWDEVAYRILVNVPDAWGEIRGDIELSMPEPPDEVTVTEVES